jgi:predicted ATPase
VHIGTRALTILIALVERAGTMVPPRELLRIGWPGVVVEPANLRVQIGTLRKLLEDRTGKGGVIETIPQRGYCFVAPVERIPHNLGAVESNLPAQLTTIVGHDETIEALVQAISQRRLITLTGPGGVGKTTLALAAARKYISRYPAGARFVDFAEIVDARLVPTLCASALGIATPSQDPVADLIANLQGTELLLILDTCEHLIGPVTLLTEKLLTSLPQLRILTTSRETLRAHGEWLFRLQPLALSAAVELFLQRAANFGDGLELRDGDTSLVARICQQLDRLPLAIELAAAHVDEMGLRELAARLDQHVSILTRGRRTAPPRHQTLAASLEWSYDLLPAKERTVLQRLSALRGPFTAEAARAIATYDLDPRESKAILSGLHAKSLVTAEIGRDVVLYRLLDTTRSFAAQAPPREWSPPRAWVSPSPLRPPAVKHHRRGVRVGLDPARHDAFNSGPPGAN